MCADRGTTWALLSCGMLLVTVGCGKDFMNRTEVITTTPQTVHQIQSTPWDGPKARVAVMEFTNETGVLQQTSQHSTTIQVVSPAGGPTPVVTVRDPIGSGMRNQLITALMQTGAFIVLERGRGLEDVVREQDGIPGRMREEVPRIARADAHDRPGAKSLSALQLRSAGGLGNPGCLRRKTVDCGADAQDARLGPSGTGRPE